MIFKKTKKIDLKILFFLIGIVFLWALGWWYPLKFQNDPGVFGDMFGAVNSLFSGLAFAGLIYTIFQQRQEIKILSNEYKDNNKHFETQNSLMQRQNEETFLFKLLEQLSILLNEIEIKDKNNRLISLLNLAANNRPAKTIDLIFKVDRNRMIINQTVKSSNNELEYPFATIDYKSLHRFILLFDYLVNWDKEKTKNSQPGFFTSKYKNLINAYISEDLIDVLILLNLNTNIFNTQSKALLEKLVSEQPAS